MKKIFEIAGSVLVLVGMAAGDSITMDGTSMVVMIVPVFMIAAGAGIMFLAREGAR